MELLKLLSTNEIVAQTASFLILLFLLMRFAWKPFLKILDERKERIASEFKSIEDTKAEIARIKGEYEKHIDMIDDTAQRRIQEAVAAGKRMAEAMKESAKEEAQKMIDGANEAIKAETAKAREELKEAIVDLAIGAAEKVIQEKLTTDQDKKLVEDFLRGMDKIK